MESKDGLDAFLSDRSANISGRVQHYSPSLGGYIQALQTTLEFMFCVYVLALAQYLL